MGKYVQMVSQNHTQIGSKVVVFVAYCEREENGE